MAFALGMSDLSMAAKYPGATRVANFGNLDLERGGEFRRARL